MARGDFIFPLTITLNENADFALQLNISAKVSNKICAHAGREL